MSARDEQGNTFFGDVFPRNCANSYIASKSRLVTAIGLSDCVVVEDKDSVLVAHKDHCQDVKALVDELNRQGRKETELHRQVFRPWGSYDSIDCDEGFQAKRLIVNPGAVLSLCGSRITTAGGGPIPETAAQAVHNRWPGRSSHERFIELSIPGHALRVYSVPMTSKKPHFPKFLGIGAARCGTTWLADSLSRSPEVWIPRVKEIHYFTRSPRYPGPSQLADGSLARRLLSRELPYRRYRHKLLRSIASNVVRPSLDKLSWDANYLLRKPGDQWYASLFSQGHGKVTGEITPRYCVLELDDIERLRALMPDVRLLFLMREPVERTWSVLKYHELRQGLPLTSLPIDQLRARAMHPALLQQSDYESILRRWRTVFPPEQMLIACFDEIIAAPEMLLDRICRFLGVKHAPLPPRHARADTKVNASYIKPMPGALQSILIDHYSPMVERLAESEGGCVRHWLSGYHRQPAVMTQRRDPGPVPVLGRH